MALIFFLSGIRLAVRARIFGYALFSLMVLGFSVVAVAQFSGRQPASLSLDVGISIIRLFLPLMLVVMTQELLFREFDRRYFLVSLAYPSSRRSFLLGRFFSLVALCLVLLLVMAGVLAVLVWFIAEGYKQGSPVDLGGGYLIVVLFIALDFLVLAALSCLLAVIASSQFFVLVGTFGFMVVARSYAAIIELLTHNSYVVSDAETYRAGLGTLGYFIPNLGALDVRMISVYGRMEFFPLDWPLLIASHVSYILGLLALAVWAFNQKKFS